MLALLISLAPRPIAEIVSEVQARLKTTPQSVFILSSFLKGKENGWGEMWFGKDRGLFKLYEANNRLIAFHELSPEGLRTLDFVKGTAKITAVTEAEKNSKDEETTPGSVKPHNIELTFTDNAFRFAVGKRVTVLSESVRRGVRRIEFDLNSTGEEEFRRATITYPVSKSYPIELFSPETDVLEAQTIRITRRSHTPRPDELKIPQDLWDMYFVKPTN